FAEVEAGATRRGGVGRPGARRSAASLSASTYTGTAANVPPPGTRTRVSASPAITWAFVATIPGRTTQPEPSMPRPQELPSILTTLRSAARAPGAFRTLGSGGGNP